MYLESLAAKVTRSHHEQERIVALCRRLALEFGLDLGLVAGLQFDRKSVNSTMLGDKTLQLLLERLQVDQAQCLHIQSVTKNSLCFLRSLQLLLLRCSEMLLQSNYEDKLVNATQ